MVSFYNANFIIVDSLSDVKNESLENSSKKATDK